MADVDSPRFERERVETQDGYTIVAWSLDGAADGDEYQVHLVGPDEDRVAYEGTFDSFFLSGLPDGEYTLHVRHRSAGAQAWGGWSPPLTLVVGHHPLVLAYGLFFAGAIMVICIVAFLVRHAGDTERPSVGGAA